MYLTSIAARWRMAQAAVALVACATVALPSAAVAGKPTPPPPPAGHVLDVQLASSEPTATPGTCRATFTWTVEHPELVTEYVAAYPASHPFRGKIKPTIDSGLANVIVSWPSGTTMYVAVSASYSDGSQAPYLTGGLPVTC
jgi:hypothetical protein